MSKEPLFKIAFMSQGQVYEVYARSVGQGDLFGFIVIEELVFGEISKLEGGNVAQFPLPVYTPGDHNK